MSRRATFVEPRRRPYDRFTRAPRRVSRPWAFFIVVMICCTAAIVGMVGARLVVGW